MGYNSFKCIHSCAHTKYHLHNIQFKQTSIDLGAPTLHTRTPLRLTPKIYLRNTHPLNPEGKTQQAHSLRHSSHPTSNSSEFSIARSFHEPDPPPAPQTLQGRNPVDPTRKMGLPEGFSSNRIYCPRPHTTVTSPGPHPVRIRVSSRMHH